MKNTLQYTDADGEFIIISLDDMEACSQALSVMRRMLLAMGFHEESVKESFLELCYEWGYIIAEKDNNR